MLFKIRKRELGLGCGIVSGQGLGKTGDRLVYWNGSGKK